MMWSSQSGNDLEIVRGRRNHFDMGRRDNRWSKEEDLIRPSSLGARGKYNNKVTEIQTKQSEDNFHHLSNEDLRSFAPSRLSSRKTEATISNQNRESVFSSCYFFEEEMKEQLSNEPLEPQFLYTKQLTLPQSNASKQEENSEIHKQPSLNKKYCSQETYFRKKQHYSFVPNQNGSGNVLNYQIQNINTGDIPEIEFKQTPNTKSSCDENNTINDNNEEQNYVQIYIKKAKDKESKNDQTSEQNKNEQKDKVLQQSLQTAIQEYIQNSEVFPTSEQITDNPKSEKEQHENIELIQPNTGSGGENLKEYIHISQSQKSPRNEGKDHLHRGVHEQLKSLLSNQLRELRKDCCNSSSESGRSGRGSRSWSCSSEDLEMIKPNSCAVEIEMDGIQSKSKGNGQRRDVVRQVTFMEVWARVKTMDLSREKLLLHSIRERMGTTQKRGVFSRLMSLCTSSGSSTELQKAVYVVECQQIEAFSKVPFDVSDSLHLSMVQTIYCQLKNTDHCPIYGPHWLSIGFRHTNPKTNFAVVGIFGALQILAFIFCYKEYILDVLHKLDVLDKGNEDKMSSNPSNIESRYNQKELNLATIMQDISKYVLQWLEQGILNSMINQEKGVIHVLNKMFFSTFYIFFEKFQRINSGFLSVPIALKATIEFVQSNPQASLDLFKKQINLFYKNRDV